MALSIKTEEADRLARTLSKLTGETLTQAVTTALRERLYGEQAAERLRLTSPPASPHSLSAYVTPTIRGP